jgi:predicted phosphoribosyltransferase
MFQNREDAGEQLAALLEDEDVEADVVLAVPRGGLPVGRAVADALDVPLDVIAARKLGAPGNPELAIGSVGSDGTLWRNEDLIDRLGVEDAYVEREREEQAAVVREKLSRYRGERSPPDLTGKTALIVDDGIATGATAITCVRLAYEAGAARVVLAVPVAPPDGVTRLRQEADAVYVVDTPAHFGAVGSHYASFPQVTDEQATAYLDR